MELGYGPTQILCTGRAHSAQDAPPRAQWGSGHDALVGPAKSDTRRYSGNCHTHMHPKGDRRIVTNCLSSPPLSERHCCLICVGAALEKGHPKGCSAKESP